MQGGEDKVVNKGSVKDWFNIVPLSEKRFKEWPKCYHEIFNEPEVKKYLNMPRIFLTVN